MAGELLILQSAEMGWQGCITKDGSSNLPFPPSSPCRLCERPVATSDKIPFFIKVLGVLSYKEFSSPCVNSFQQLHGKRRPTGSPAYHVHLDQQHTQGKGLPQALQPFMDVVWMEVVVAEAGGGREGTG